MRELLEDYLGHLAVERGASAHTLDAYRRDLEAYLTHLDERGVASVDAVSREDVVSFVASLRETGYAPASVERKIAAVKGFHRFLVREGVTENHPSARLPLPKVPEHLPDVISIDEAERLLAQPFPHTAVGARDRAILEVLYGCGLRVSELVGLDVDDVDLDEGFVRVFGKGSKERVVPIGGMAAHALGTYMGDARRTLLGAASGADGSEERRVGKECRSRWSPYH